MMVLGYLRVCRAAESSPIAFFIAELQSRRVLYIAFITAEAESRSLSQSCKVALIIAESQSRVHYRKVAESR